ncbi:MAG: MBL fold metallo-hydrolase [Chloroflexi bacterium SZAS-1]|jgi:glyoxylase-like metal-dependent hydrolase (beta-lactamase superfamily II)|nr:MBL fold metallo-hydrolase [Chloroflexi bacterium SZAS-1]
MTDIASNIALIDDMHLGRAHVIATYLLHGDAPAIVDPGPASTLSTLEAGLAAEGVRLNDLHAIILTHIHLDHAGATGAILARYPHIRVYVHHRGAPHLADPAKLLRSAERLYGDAMDYLWGPVLPVPEANITTLGGGEVLQLGKRSLRVFDAPGHASHHVVFFEEASGTVFMGDTGGACLPERPVARPATPPPDIDIEGWLHTLAVVEALAPQTLLLTHFGPTYSPSAYLNDYRAALVRWAEVVRAGLHSGVSEAEQQAQLRALSLAELGHPPNAMIDLFEQASSSAQSWQGLARYWRKREGQ